MGASTTIAIGTPARGPSRSCRGGPIPDQVDRAGRRCRLARHLGCVRARDLSVTPAVARLQDSTQRVRWRPDRRTPRPAVGSRARTMAPHWLISWKARSRRYDAGGVGSTSRTCPSASVNRPDGTGTPADAQQQVLQAVDDLDGGRHLVDRRGQGLGGDVDELADAERRVLVEGARPGPGRGRRGGAASSGGVPPCTAKTGAAGGHVLADPWQQLDDAVVLGCQPDQPWRGRSPGPCRARP